MSAIDIYAPWAGASEKAIRSRLCRLRDICGAHAARTEGWAHEIWKMAEDLAADAVWKRASVEKLHAVADAVTRMIQAARRLEEGGCNA